MSLTLSATPSIYTPTKATALGDIALITGEAKGEITRGSDVTIQAKDLITDADKFTEALEYTGYTQS